MIVGIVRLIIKQNGHLSAKLLKVFSLVLVDSILDFCSMYDFQVSLGGFRCICPLGGGRQAGEAGRLLEAGRVGVRRG